MDTFDNDTTSGVQETHGRSPSSAAPFGLLMPGLGHMYVGQARRGIVLFMLMTAASGLYALWHIGELPRFWMLVGTDIVIFALFLFALIDPALRARRMDAFRPKSYNKWYIYAGACLVGYVIFAIPSLE